MDRVFNPGHHHRMDDKRRYRSVIWRGLIGMLVAPVVVIVPLTLVFVPLIAGRAPGVADLAGISAAVYVFVLRISLPAGVVTWIVLRVAGHESGRNYALAGGAEALLWAILAHRAGFRPADLAAFVFTGLVGAMIALIFWLIARSRSDLQGSLLAEPDGAT